MTERIYAFVMGTFHKNQGKSVEDADTDMNYFAISENYDTFALLKTIHTSPDGGIGRRAGLKHQWSNPCRFDPGSGYDKIP